MDTQPQLRLEERRSAWLMRWWAYLWAWSCSRASERDSTRSRLWWYAVPRCTCTARKPRLRRSTWWWPRDSCHPLLSQRGQLSSPDTKGGATLTVSTTALSLSPQLDLETTLLSRYKGILLVVASLEGGNSQDKILPTQNSSKFEELPQNAFLI